VILLDALFAGEPAFDEWLDEDPAHTMTLVGRWTWRRVRRFVRGRAGVAIADEIPRSVSALATAARGARILAVRSQLGHMQMITSGRAIPTLLPRVLHRE
jgi:hypothetical protein